MEHRCDKERELESICTDVREVRCDVKKILQRITALEIKSGMWGFMGGLAAWAIYMIQKKM